MAMEKGWMMTTRQPNTSSVIEYTNVLITYVGKVRVRDRYYDHYENQVVTRRAFYSNSKGYYDSKDKWIETPNGYFSVPQYWAMWDGELLPHTFYQYPRVMPHEVIKWKYDN